MEINKTDQVQSSTLNPLKANQNQISNQNGNILIVIGIIILLLIIGGGVYYFGKSNTSRFEAQNPTVSQTPSVTPTSSSTPNETANWKAYTKDKLWTMKYPSSWNVTQESDDGITGVTFSDSEQVSNANSGNISVRVTWAKKNDSYDSRISQEVGKVDNIGGNTYTILKKLNIDGSPGVLEQLELINNGPAKPMYLYQALISGPFNVNITANALKYSPQGFSKENYNSTYLPIFSNILSTFKFIH